MMKKGLAALSLSLVVLAAVACNRQEPPKTIDEPEATAKAPEKAELSEGVSGTVTETANAAGYTYVQVDSGSQKLWAAAPEFAVKVGDKVTVPPGVPMHKYHSKTLNRDFDVVYFVNSIVNNTGGGAGKAATPAGHAPASAAATPPEIDTSGIKKPEGGKTIAELFAEKAKLSGKEVTLRGKVVKFNAQIMGKNWFHLRDGTGDAAKSTNDLTITTDAMVKVGDTVLVTGKVLIDQDLGFGYKYSVMLEKAKVTVE
ncbi:MAG: OB-fold nucleic acid binding domain-containing protein [Pirellulales bacterium]